MDIKKEPGEELLPSNEPDSIFYEVGLQNNTKYEVFLKQETSPNDSFHEDLSLESRTIKSEVQWRNCLENDYENSRPIKIENTDLAGCSYAEFIPGQVPENGAVSPSVKDCTELHSSVIEIEVEQKPKTIQPEPVPIVIVNRVLFNERNFVCSICYDFFGTFDSLRAHRVIHGELKVIKHKTVTLKSQNSDKPFNCDACDFKSARFFDMKQHKMTHSREKPFKCKFCDFETSRSFSLKTHTMLHSGERPFKCDGCDFKTARSHDLKRHKIMSHSSDGKTEISNPSHKPFKCESCDFASSRLFTLKRHRMVHSGEKPLKCNSCGFKSARLHDLKRHMTSHSGDKPFTCDMCDFKTARSYDLRRHKLLHKETNLQMETCEPI